MHHFERWVSLYLAAKPSLDSIYAAASSVVSKDRLPHPKFLADHVFT
jgi:hypothetical protein